MHLLEVQSIQNLDEYHDDLKALLGFVKYQRNLHELLAFIQSNEAYFSKLPKEAYDAINTVSDVKELEHYIAEFEEQEEINMCEALQQLRNEQLSLGISQGRLQEKKNTAVEMLKIGLSFDIIGQTTKLTPAEIIAIAKKNNLTF